MTPDRTTRLLLSVIALALCGLLIRAYNQPTMAQAQPPPPPPRTGLGERALVGYQRGEAATVTRSARDRSRSDLYVEDFGAVGDGRTDDAAAIQAAVDAIDKTKGGTVHFHSGKTYKVSRTITLPVKGWSYTVPLRLVGYGATISTTAAIAILKRIPANQPEAEANVTLRLIVEGLSFTGNSTTGQKGIDLGATYASVFRDCMFNFLDVGLDLQFCLNAQVQGCHANSCKSYGFRARCGVDWGGNTLNSQSNHTTFSDCRFYHAAGSTAGLYVGGSSGISIRDCIFEGFNPTNYVLIDTQGGTNAKYHSVTNMHAEGGPTNVIRYIGGGGSLVVDGIFFQQASGSGTVMVDATGSAGGTVVRVANCHATAYLFKDAQGAAIWCFDHVGGYGQLNPRKNSHWVGGAVPNGIYALGADDQGTGGQLQFHSITTFFRGNLQAHGNLRFSPDDTYHLGGAGARPLGVAVGSEGVNSLGPVVTPSYALQRFRVEANTAGAAAPNVLSAAETRAALTNEGAAARNHHTLPTAAAGLEYTFIVQDADGMRVTAAAGDRIRIGARVSAAAGFVESATVGDTVRLLAINATEWVSVGHEGAWTVK